MYTRRLIRPEHTSAEIAGPAWSKIFPCAIPKLRYSSTNLIQRLFVHGKRFFPEVHYIAGFWAGKVNANAAHPIWRLCGVLKHQSSDNRVGFSAVETPNLLGPCNMCGGLVCECL